MATIEQLQADLQKVADGIAALAVEIQDLKSQPTAVTQAQLDALDTQATAMVAAIGAAK